MLSLSTSARVCSSDWGQMLHGEEQVLAVDVVIDCPGADQSDLLLHLVLHGADLGPVSRPLGPLALHEFKELEAAEDGRRKGIAFVGLQPADCRNLSAASLELQAAASTIVTADTGQRDWGAVPQLISPCPLQSLENRS